MSATLTVKISRAYVLVVGDSARGMLHAVLFVPFVTLHQLRVPVVPQTHSLQRRFHLSRGAVGVNFAHVMLRKTAVPAPLAAPQAM